VKVNYVNRAAIILGVICIVLTASLLGAIVHYGAVIKDKDDLIASLQSRNSMLQTWLRGNITYYELQMDKLNQELDALNQTHQKLYVNYTVLLNAGVVFDGLKISDLKVKGDLNRESVMGNITNMSNGTMSKVYVILFTFNINGSLDNYQVRTIENLAINETKSFEFPHVLEKNQAFRIFAIGSYGSSDIENNKIAELLAKVEELNVNIEHLNARINDLEIRNAELLAKVEELNVNIEWLEARIRELEETSHEVYILTDQAYYYSVRADLQRANRSILVAMYSMVYDPYHDPPHWANDLIEELINAKRRGVNVRVIIEYRTYSGFLDNNLRTCSYLFSNGVSVTLDDKPDTDHLKLVIIDDEIIYVGSHDWNEPSLFSDHEISVKIVSEKLAQTLKEYIETNFR
jgi:predicted nuclease with TOPRIM domain